MTTENNVAAQAGDCQHRRQATTALGAITGAGWKCRDCGVLISHKPAPDASQAGDEPMRAALQVCVKALEFRKDRNANDEFALNLARIALAGVK